MSTHESAKRTEARSRGLRLAAKVATVGGIAVAALGLVEAGAASASPARALAPAHVVASDDAKALPLEGLRVIGGNCGCAPCWGPPAPPAKRSRAARAAAKKPSRRRGAR